MILNYSWLYSKSGHTKVGHTKSTYSVILNWLYDIASQKILQQTRSERRNGRKEMTKPKIDFTIIEYMTVILSLCPFLYFALFE